MDPDLECSQPEFLVEVPDDFEAISQENLSLAADGQAKIRKVFQHYFNQGYLAADFLVMSGPPRRTFYLFTKTFRILAAPGSGDRMGHRRRGEEGFSGPRPGVLSA